MNLPIAERELRIASRAPRTYRGRLIACVIFGAITGWMFWFSSKIGSMATIAPQTFTFIGHMALIMCMFSANVTADALSSEKRNGTLGLLFLTDLKSWDIVFGKLASLGLVTFYGLVGIIPILAMPVLMGGISGQTVLRSALTLLNALFLALSIGLWVSSRSWEQKRAMNGAVWIVISLLWLLPALATLLRIRYGLIDLSNFVYMLSPMYQQDRSNPFGVGMINDMYWRSLAITHFMGWIALWAACATLPHAWQDRAVASVVGRWKKFWHELRYGSAQARVELRSRLLRINAVHWLSSREKFAPVNAWLFVAAVMVGWVGLWAWLRATVPNGPPFWGIGIPCAMILYLGLRIRACGLAGEIIARDRFSGALELLLSTTLTERDVVRGQWLTIVRTLLGPAIATIAVGTLIFIAGLFETHSNDLGTAWVVYIGLVSLFIFDLVASVWTGMWTACFSRTQAAAPGQAIIRLLLIPWLIFVAITTIFAWLKIGRDSEFIDVFSGWWLICVINNLFWTARSRNKFYARLRTAAAERYQPAPSRERWWQFFSLRRRAVREIGLSKAA